MIHRIRLLLLLSAAFIALAAHNAFAAQGEIIVAKSGGQFTSIQAAINSVNPTADNPYVIKVMPGTYTENVVMKSYISLHGSGRETTTIASPVLTGGTVVVDIYSVTQVGISGFTITNGYYGIRNELSSKVTITDNTVKANYWTGSHNRSTGETVISRNNITGQINGAGIGVDGYTTTGPIIIENNYIAQNPVGILVYKASPQIINNLITVNQGLGIYNYGSAASLINGNTISSNGGGIGNYDSSAPTIASNSITASEYNNVTYNNNSAGTLSGNIITGSKGSGVLAYDTAAPQILHNRITNNATYFTYAKDVYINTSGAPNISFNVYDTLYGTSGVGLYNVKSDGTPAPAP